MSCLSLPSKRYSQPQFSAPVSKQFDALITTYQIIGPVSTTGLPIREVVSDGTGINFGSGNYFSLPIGIIKDSGGGGNYLPACYSIDIGVIIQGSVSNQTIFQFGTDANSGLWSYMLSLHNGNIDFYDGSYTTIVTSPVAQKAYNIRISYSDFSPYVFRIWCNGVLIYSSNGYRFQISSYAMFIGSGYFGACSTLKIQYLAIQTGAEADLGDGYSRSVTENPWQLLAPRKRRVYPVASVSLQLLSPASDITAGAWLPSTGATLYGTIDESTASDTDYIYTTSATTCRIKLQAGNDPVSSTGHALNYRILPGTGTLTVAFGSGSTTVATWNHTITGAAQDISQTLSGAQADSITDYSDLWVDLTSS